ncbi:hypothetical protein PZT57_27020 [Pseudomonas aeruginosa]|uniref:hypothetical protein n=1 Tax=Pseudomonas aeruginosa TaxID=287 RepID=UPI002B2752AA|nr:hypothetical protein [Pseudomonas aeruginosa]MEA8592304.1 hypothetical protein [Pseudomonas aeruginosa]
MSKPTNAGIVNLKFQHENGKGWAQVPHSLIWELGIQNDISTKSFVDEQHVYLAVGDDLDLLYGPMRDKGLSLWLLDDPSACIGSICAKQQYSPAFLPKPQHTVDLAVSVEFEVRDGSGSTRTVQDSFNWNIPSDSCRLAVAERIEDEVSRQSRFGWLQGKTLKSTRVTNSTRYMQDGRYLEFPVVAVP